MSAHLYPYGNNYIGYGVPNGNHLLALLRGEELKPPISLWAYEVTAVELGPFPIDRHDIVLFQKSTDKNVISQQLYEGKRQNVVIEKPPNAKRTTIAHPDKVFEIIWEK